MIKLSITPTESEAMINLEILPVAPLPKDVFILKCIAGFGDADGQEEVTVGSFENTTEGLVRLEDAVRCCERMKNRFPYGMGGEDNYEDVEGFAEWFHGGDNWPNDPMTDHQCSSSMDSYFVIYFDTNGYSHPVKVTLS